MPDSPAFVNQNMTVPQVRPADQAIYTVKVLNGVLSGAEFALFSGRTLFVVGSEQTVAAASLPQDMIYLPGNDTEPNVEVILPQAGGEDNDRFDLIVLYGDRSEPCDAYFQQVVTVGEQRFAIKRALDPWSMLPAVAVIDTQPLPVSQGKTWRVAGLVIGLALILVTSIGWLIWRDMPSGSDSRMLNLQRRLLGARAAYSIYPDRQQGFYVFAASERDAAWARQALVRRPYDAPVYIVTIADEKRRIGQLLDRQGVAWFTLRLDNPLRPVLLVSQDRNTLDAKRLEYWQHQLANVMPYAEQVKIAVYADQQLIHSARAGLNRLAVTYNDRPDDHSMAFVIAGDLDDTTLVRCQAWIEQFYQQWGDRYVTFAVELQEDKLKGQSFQYGRDGYIKLAPSHWYFPSPLKLP